MVEKSEAAGKYWGMSEANPVTRAWYQNKDQLRAMAGLGTLWDDLEAGYGELTRINAIRTGRIFRSYPTEQADRLSDAIVVMRKALATLDERIAALDKQAAASPTL
jgi:hypothetical protein